MTKETGMITATTLTYQSHTEVSSTNPIINGGFETGDFTGWDNHDIPEVQVTTSAKRSGNYGVSLSPTGAGLGQWSLAIAELTQPITLSICDFESMDIWYKIPYCTPDLGDGYPKFIILLQYSGAPE